MGYIYKITNIVSGKSYIGQTIMSIRERMNKHYSNAKTATTGIDYALAKYGKEAFVVEELCSCPNQRLDELERYYIDYYDTYNNGYNLTIGGQKTTSRLILDETKIVNQYIEGSTIIDLAHLYHCSDKVIHNILVSHNVAIRHQNNESNLLLGKKFVSGDNAKPIKIVELNLQFASLKECAEWLMKHNYSKANSMEATRKSISRVLTGQRQTYCKFHFVYV